MTPVMLRILALLSLFLLASCQPDEVAPMRPDPDRPAALQADCLAKGGKWIDNAGSGLFVCQFPTSDSGKTCRAEGDCEGYCLSRSRTCAPVKPLFGCQDVLDALGRPSTICLN